MSKTEEKDFCENPIYRSLEKGQEIIVAGEAGVVKESHGKYYILVNGKYGSNRIPFRKIHKDDGKALRTFVKEILGYYDDGNWPCCKTLEDLTKLVNAVNEEYNKLCGPKDEEKGFIEGAWYRYKYTDCIIQYSGATCENCGFTKDGIWLTGAVMSIRSFWVLVSNSTVEKLLMAEAKKRGLVAGAVVNLSTINKEYVPRITLVGDSYVYRYNYFALSSGGPIIYEKGKWATLVEAAKPTESLLKKGQCITLGEIMNENLDNHTVRKVEIMGIQGEVIEGKISFYELAQALAEKVETLTPEIALIIGVVTTREVYDKERHRKYVQEKREEE